MRLIVLASGSAGNAALIESSGRAVLLDAGISAAETMRRIRAAGAADARIEAILVTHEHSDHVRGVRVLSRRLGVPVVGTTGTLQALAGTLGDVPETIAISGHEQMSLAGMRIRSFPTAHDAAEPCGFGFESRRGHRVAITTDTGVVTPEALEVLEGAHVIGIEANHDQAMLDEGPYPPFLKRRIASDNGHLSNTAAAAALRSVAWDGLSQVFALHLSQHNNTADAARTALASVLSIRCRAAFETVEHGQIAGCFL